MKILPFDCEVRGNGTCNEMPVILVDRVVDKKRKIGKNGEPRRRRGTRGCCPPPQKKAFASDDRGF
jgi:hypothetical protein